MSVPTVRFLAFFVLVTSSVAFPQISDPQEAAADCTCVDITLRDGNSGKRIFKSKIYENINFQENILGTVCHRLTISFGVM